VFLCVFHYYLCLCKLYFL